MNRSEAFYLETQILRNEFDIIVHCMIATILSNRADTIE